MLCAAIRFLTGVVKPKSMNKKNLEHTLIPRIKRHHQPTTTRMWKIKMKEKPLEKHEHQIRKKKTLEFHIGPNEHQGFRTWFLTRTTCRLSPKDTSTNKQPNIYSPHKSIKTERKKETRSSSLSLSLSLSHKKATLNFWFAPTTKLLWMGGKSVHQF